MRDYDGQLDVGFWAHGAINLGALPVLTDDDLDGEPDLKPKDLSDADTTFYRSTPIASTPTSIGNRSSMIRTARRIRA
jgi:hypothetical protein